MSDVTNESSTAWLTDLRMLWSRRKTAKQLETVFDMWVFIDTSLSMKIPRFRTYFTGCTISQPTWRGMLGRRSCWRGDVHNCSDLAAFSCRRFTFIHSDDGVKYCMKSQISLHRCRYQNLSSLPAIFLHMCTTHQCTFTKCNTRFHVPSCITLLVYRARAGVSQTLLYF